MILTADELTELTDRTRPAAQARELTALGIPYKPRRDGTLIVLRTAVQVALGYAPTHERSPSPKLRIPETRRVLAR